MRFRAMDVRFTGAATAKPARTNWSPYAPYVALGLRKPNTWNGELPMPCWQITTGGGQSTFLGTATTARLMTPGRNSNCTHSAR